MSALAVSVIQLVDLAVNPELGTVNTSLLHNLLHIMINQLQMSAGVIEFHGSGSAAIEKLIAVSRRHCELRINEFELREEIDEPTGNVVEIRKEVEKAKCDETAKLFTVREVKANCPLGHPLAPIQILSTENLPKLRADSIHDVMAEALPSDEDIISAEKPGMCLKVLFDYVNHSKRLDALEIGIRQLADVLKRSQSDDIKRLDTMKSKIDPELTTLSNKVDSLADELKLFNCKCNAEGFEARLFDDFSEKFGRELDDRFAAFQSQMENLESLCQSTLQRLQGESEQFKGLVCERLDGYKDDLVSCLSEIQEMLDAKLDKLFVPELKQYIEDVIGKLEDKVDSADCSKRLAAGATMRIFTKLNCVSCGEHVIQVDRGNPRQATRNECEKIQRCGGNKTAATVEALDENLR